MSATTHGSRAGFTLWSVALGGLVIATGVAVVASPFVWLETWRLDGFSSDYVPFLAWQLTPYVILGVLVGWRRLRRVVLAFGLLAGLIAATLLLLSATGDAFEPATNFATFGPALFALAICAVWALDAGLTSRRRPVGERDAPLAPKIAAAVVVVVGLLVAGRLWIGDVATAETFLVIFTSIVLEALPFVLLGSLVSGLIEVFVSDRAFEAYARLPLGLQVPSAAVAALAMPVCECGSVPVARRLMLRGVHPAAGVTFMLAAPILNPIVLLSTVVAYQGRGALEMVIGRAGLGLVLATAAGLLIVRMTSGGLLKPRAPEPEHHHHHQGRLAAVIDHGSSDFFFMGRFVVAGAALAAAMQTLVPQSVFAGVLASPLVGTVLLMVLAFMLSLCSEADAFVAVSFIQFPLGPQLAFLVLGPVLDLKLALLYGVTFGRGFVLRLALVAVPIVFAGSMLFNLAVG